MKHLFGINSRNVVVLLTTVVINTDTPRGGMANFIIYGWKCPVLIIFHFMLCTRFVMLSRSFRWQLQTCSVNEDGAQQNISLLTHTEEGRGAVLRMLKKRLPGSGLLFCCWAPCLWGECAFVHSCSHHRCLWLGNKSIVRLLWYNFAVC